MRVPAVFLSAIAVLVLSGCEQETDGESESVTVPVEAAGATDAAEPSTPLEVGQSTPMAERVATIGLLNKRNNVTKDFELRPGESVEDGPVILTLAACERTAPFEMPQETGAFVQVDVRERGDDEHTRVFSGWLFKENPSLNVVEHPIYDVWVKNCAMAFPGDE
ncbi:hypothetical protein MACH24_08790 [Erythrobacter sp. Dej080120_24]|uniref:DUF2155 domain-containing protein n=1 Tax=Erythrobacter sp. Dej080120_24 TaxID=3024837 RepID=UPI00291F6487|nr:hypothetical protein MACH24_08790 [Erythrobacter sp. Dej080120_24]